MHKKVVKSISAQSAIEYLMTYGWAILIIAVVLAALFELGVFNGSNLSPQACIAQAGFVCKNPVYTANGIGIIFGQTTGREYFDSFMFIAAEGEPLSGTGIPQNFTDPSNGLFIGNLLPGQTVGADFNASKFAYGQIPANAPIGTPFAGYVWLGYCLSPCSAPTAYSKVATITAKEAGTSSASFGGYFGGGSGSSSPPPSGPQVGNVIFTADPLPTDTPWSVTYNGVMESANTPSNIVFTGIPTDVSLPYTTNAPTVTPSACYSTNSISGSASGGQTVPVQFSQAPCYANITIDSAGGSAPTGFQQMLQFNPSSYSNYEASDLGNLRFYQGSTELYSWCESGCTSGSTSAIFWVKTNGLASGTTPNAITMYLEPLSGNKGQYSSPTGHAGEAPQLSSSYAQYDNGANVFIDYWNFAGSSLPTGWQTYTNCQPVAAAYYQTNVGSPFMLINNPNGGRWVTGISTATNTGSIQFAFIFYPGVSYWGDDGTTYGLYTSPSNGGTLLSSAGPSSFPIQMGVGYDGSRVSSLYGANFTMVPSSATPFSSTNYIFFSSDTYGLSGCGSVSVNNGLTLTAPSNPYPPVVTTTNFVATAYYPPNGVMPSPSFEPVQ